MFRNRLVPRAFAPVAFVLIALCCTAFARAADTPRAAKPDTADRAVPPGGPGAAPGPEVNLAGPLVSNSRLTCGMALAAGVTLTVDSPLCVSTPAAVADARPVSGAAVSLLSTPNSGTGDKVGLTVRVVSDNGRANAWSWNSVLDIRPHDPATRPRSMAGGEIDINNLDCDAGADPAGAPRPGCSTWSKGLWLTGLTGPGFQPVTDGMLVTATGGGKLYHNGIRFLGDHVIDQTIYDGSGSAVSLRVAGSHGDGVDLSRALFSGGAIRLANEQKVCFQADCRTYAVFSGPANGVEIVVQGQVVATVRSDTVILAKPVQVKGSFSTAGAASIDGQYLRMPNLPRTDPHVRDALWDDPACNCIRRSR